MADEVGEIVDTLLTDRPAFHGGGTQRWDALPSTLRTIGQLVSPGDRTVESGCGASTVVFAARGAHHTAISPHAGEHQKVREYLNQIGVDTADLNFIVGRSELVLPGLLTERTLDMALIDGDHAFPIPVIDWYYMAQALKVGRPLLLDDIPIPSVACVFRCAQSDSNWRLERILDERAAVFTLIGDPAIEDWALQPFNRHLDYRFAPFLARARLTLRSEASRIARRLALRYPALRRTWNRLRNFSH